MRGNQASNGRACSGRGIRRAAVGSISKRELARCVGWIALGLAGSAGLVEDCGAQVPAGAAEQLRQVVGNRVEALTILGGDYAAASGLYSFRGGKVANVSISKLGGGGDTGEAMPLFGRVKWSPMILGNLGYIESLNKFESGVLAGNKLKFETLGVEGGAGARFHLTDHLSLAPTLSGIYGHTENDFVARNPVGDVVEQEGRGTLVGWEVDTWSVVPALDLRYEWKWKRASFIFTSGYDFYHTESFESTSSFVHVDGDSHTWENKLDVDVPVGWSVMDRELHVGGFFSRNELFGGAADGLNSDYFYTANGRVVFDFLGHLWKLRWFGLGVSYFWSENFSGWSAGIDAKFQF